MTWGVVATVHEPPAVVLAFVAHYLRLGAASVDLFLDGPAPEVQTDLQDVPACRVRICDHRYWAQFGGRPTPIFRRQICNAQLAYDSAEVDWLFHADADEFLWPRGDVMARLRAVAGKSDTVAVPVWERCHRAGTSQDALFQGPFRAAFDPNAPPDGTAMPETIQRYLRGGLVGYVTCKSFWRVGRGLAMHIHSPRDPDVRQITSDMALLHFEGFTAKSWVQKMLRQAMQANWKSWGNSHRRRQLEALHQMSAAEAERFYWALKSVTPDQEDALQNAGLWLEPDLDPVTATRDMFGSAADAFDVERFDSRGLPTPIA